MRKLGMDGMALVRRIDFSNISIHIERIRIHARRQD